MTKKRDRWDSSSSDEDETPIHKKNKSKSISSTNNIRNGTDIAEANKNITKIQGGDSSISQKLLPLHNPLLQGCRSVYDTYDRIARLSEGTYGIVWKAKDLTTQEIVALKQIKFDPQQQQNQGFPVTALREINVLLALSHTNIVTVKEMVVGTDLDKVFMVMEFMQMDLQEAMERRKYPNVLRQGELKGILQQILRGMNHMHTQWFMHRDMKTSNILVHKTGRAAICDLGLARRFQDPPIKYTQLVVTLWYRAPELLFGEERYTPGKDYMLCCAL
jgi:cell division cycle 2-like protein